MKKIGFTVARIENFTCEPTKKQSLYWDTKAPGLGVRVTTGGSRAYIFESRLFGKTVRTTIGDCRSWDLGKARSEATRLKTLIDSGTDPREHRAEQQAAHQARQNEARRRDVTVGDAWDEYVEARAPMWSDLHTRDHKRLADEGGVQKRKGSGKTQAGPIATLRPIKLSDLDGTLITAWLTKQAAERPTMAALSFRLLRAFIRWAHETPAYRGLVPENAYRTRDVREAIPRVKPKEGDVLQREQLAAWFAAVRDIPNFTHSVYLQGLLLTGARREELASLQWTDVDLNWRSLTVNDKVEGTGGRTIPLPPYLAALLLELKLRNETPPTKRQIARLEAKGQQWSPSAWVFASPTSADGKIAEPRIAHVKALQAAQLPHLTLHGLRRSFATLSEWCEVPVGVIAQIQGHKPSAIAEKHYRRRPLDLLRKWHDQLETWLLTQAKIALPNQQAPKTLAQSTDIRTEQLHAHNLVAD